MIAPSASQTLSEHLPPFEDISIQNSTIVPLHKNLAKIWPATRSCKVAESVKVAVLTMPIANGPKIVILTAYALLGDEKRSLAAGIDAYLSNTVQM